MSIETCGCNVYVSRRGLLASEYESGAGVSMCALHKAAPELLEALKDAEALVVGWACLYAMRGCTTEAEYSKATDIEGWNPVHQKIYRKVKSAIAKAEGK